MQLAIQLTARSMGETAGAIVSGLLDVLAGEVGTYGRLRARVRSMENKTETLFALLGKTCYRLMDQGKNCLREQSVLDLLERIEACQTELKRIRQMAAA